MSRDSRSSEQAHRLSAPAVGYLGVGAARSPACAARRITRLRVGRGLRKPANWVQLVKFSAVGATGYVVNLAVYSTLVKVASVHYILAAVLAFCVAVTNNFLLNRHWTFRATDGHMGFQAARFFTVSVLALGLNLIVLELLVSVGDMDKVVAQAIAILAATPLNFIGNKLWSFGKPAPRPSP